MATTSSWSSPSVDQFAHALSEVPSWYNLGVFLLIPTTELDRISDQYSRAPEGTLRCLIEVYKSMERGRKSLSWKSIAEALRLMKNYSLADEIHSRYIKPRSTIQQHSTPTNQVTHSPSPLSTVTYTPATQHDGSSMTEAVVAVNTSVPVIHNDPLPLTPQAQVESMIISQSSNEPLHPIHIDAKEHKPVSLIANKYETLSTRFESILVEMRQAVIKENINIAVLQHVVRRQCDSSPSPQEIATVDAAFTKIVKSCSILNFSAVKLIVTALPKDDEIFTKQLTSLEQSVKKLKSSADMARLVTLINNKQTIPTGGQKRVKLKLQEFWRKPTYAQFEIMINKLFQKLQDKMARITVSGKGCICVNWIIPDIDTTELVPVLPLEFIQLIGVIYLHIGSKTIYNIEGDECESIEAAMLQAIKLKNTQAIELLLAVGCSPQVATYTDSNTVTNIVNIKAIESEEGPSGSSGGVDYVCILGHNKHVEAIIDPSSEPECSVKEKMIVQLHQENVRLKNINEVQMKKIEEFDSEIKLLKASEEKLTKEIYPKDFEIERLQAKLAKEIDSKNSEIEKLLSEIEQFKTKEAKTKEIVQDTKAHEVMKEPDSLIDNQLIDENINEEDISYFSDSSVEMLKEAAEKRNVDIDIERDPDLHFISLHGYSADVMAVKDKVRDVLASLGHDKVVKETDVNERCDINCCIVFANIKDVFANEDAPIPKEYDKDKLIIVKEIPKEVDEDLLVAFIEGKLGLESEEDFQIDFRNTCAIIMFNEEHSDEELNGMIKKLTKRKIKKQTLVFERCEVNCCIVFSNIKDAFANEDALEVYLEQKKSGAGYGMVENIRMLGNNSAKVTFISPAVVSQVLHSMSHHKKILGADVTLTVCTPLDSIEKPPESSDDDIDIDAPVTYPCDQMIAIYLKKTPSVVQELSKDVEVSIAIDEKAGNVTLSQNEFSPQNWPAIVAEKWEQCLSDLVYKTDIHVPSEGANEIYPIIMAKSTQEGLEYAFGKGDNKVCLVGKADVVRKLENDIKELCSRIIKKSEAITLSEEDYEFLKGVMFTQMQSDHRSIQLKCIDLDHSLSANGSLHDVGVLKQSLPRYISHSRIQISLHPLAIEFLRVGKGGPDVLRTLLQGTVKCVPYYVGGTGGYTLYLLFAKQDAYAADSMVRTVSSNIKVQPISLPRGFASSIVKGSKYANFKENLIKKFPHLSMMRQDHTLVVVSAIDVFSFVHQGYHQFINEECSSVESVRFRKGAWRLLHTTSVVKLWSDLTTELKKIDVSIVSMSKPSAQKPFVKIKGMSDSIEIAKEKISALQKSIVERDIPIARPGVCNYFFKDLNGQMVLKGIENEANVCIEMDIKNHGGSDLGNTSLGSSGSSPEFLKACFGNTNEMKQVNVYVGDITEFNRAEVIVNAANQNLQHAGGVAQAIEAKGGPQIRRDSENHIRLKGKVNTGHAVIIPNVGNLPSPYKAIVHAVGPRWEYKTTTEKAFLRKAMEESLTLAKDYSSIAIPAISGGIYGFPPDVCAEVLMDAVKRFSQKNVSCSLNEINFVVFQNNVDTFVSTAKKVFNNIHCHSDMIPDTSSTNTTPSTTQTGRRQRRAASTTPVPTPTVQPPAPVTVSNNKTASTSRQQNNIFQSSVTKKIKVTQGEGIDLNMLDNLSKNAEITLTIFGETHQSVGRAERRLLSIIDNELIDENINEEDISYFSDFSVEMLKEAAEKRNVDIDIERDPDLHFIFLHGFSADVMAVKDKVRDVLASLGHDKVVKEAAEAMAKHIRWIRILDDDDTDDEYDSVFTFEIESAFQRKDKKYVSSKQDEKFEIDFSKMEETDLVYGDKVKVKRLDLLQEEKPTNWDPMPTDSTGKEVEAHYVPLQAGSQEYTEIEQRFNATMQKGKDYKDIVSIERIQNPILYGQFAARKRKMDKRNPSNCTNERLLFHGTSPDVVNAITTQGFNRSFHGKNAVFYGQGAYFARDATCSNHDEYSVPDASGVKNMYVARVLTGEYTLGNSNMLVPPAKNPQLNKHVLFDSTVDNMASPSIYVVYGDYQSYPAYLIKYKKN